MRDSNLLQHGSIAAWHQETAAARPPDEDLYQPSEMIATAGRKQQANKASWNSGLTQPASIAAWHQGTAAARPPDEDLYKPSEMIATARRNSKLIKHHGTADYYSRRA